ncbi:porin [Sediminicoccus sp. KRV36]|uniref:porin n=1 Tax=Sediminicoccus sp. KRV36 TaxID=3133721 RepID=UPI00201018F9|nr:porin [Sediminicoccus rosea]UPY36626.1 porin [Sediminicoccus rosea]
MRKILLGTTAVVSAVVGAAVMAPQASAQEAPTVRLGGFFRAYYGYTQQSSAQSTTSTGLPVNVGGGTENLPGVAPSTTATNNQARLGKHDISTDAGIDVIVNGKLANGLTYGATISLNSSGIEGRQVVQGRASAGKTTVAVDEMYAFIAHPRFGQIRFGDEDGVMGGLMNSGWVQGFGTGGVHGSWESFVTRQAGGRTTTAPGGLGDASKIIYMTPQWAGFDFGASFAPNANTGEDVGCPNNGNSGYCDRATAFTGARNFGIYAAGPEQAARRNEYQLAARWRGNLGGVGVAATVGYIGAGAARDLTTAGAQQTVFNNMNIWQAGVQASYAGFTVGANYTYGDYNFFWGNTLRGDRQAEQIVVGGQYVAGPITVGANFVTGLFEGGNRDTFTDVGNRFTVARTPVVAGTSTNAAMMRRWGMGAGANYRLAPGMDLIAEYVYYSVREQGRDLDPNRGGIQSRAFSNVFLTGVRLAF